VPFPNLLDISDSVQEVASTTSWGFSSIALTRSGEVYAWGEQALGAQYLFGLSVLRMPTNIMEMIRPALYGGERIIHLYEGLDTFYFLTDEGRILFAGNNNRCAAGTNVLGDVAVPTDITGYLPLVGGEKVIKLIVGEYRAIALTDRHNVYSWGENQYGETGLGLGAGTDVCIPMSLLPNLHLSADEYVIDGRSYYNRATVLWTNKGNLYLFGNSAEYEVMGYGEYFPEPTLISTDVVTAAFGTALMLVVREGGHRLWVLGANLPGMGDGTNTAKLYLEDITPFLHLAAGEIVVRVVTNRVNESEEEAALILTNYGRLLVFGDGYDGQLGDGKWGTYSDDSTMYHSTIPIDITSNLVNETVDVTGVRFGNRPALSYEVINEHLIRAIVPPGEQLGYVDIFIDGNAAQIIPGGYEYVPNICIM
jgi:alpha-tubulin suppressor-like RCC1 family protein